MIFSRAPPISVAEIPPEPREPTTVSTSSLEAVPISAELKPASSRLATDVEVILLKTVSVAVESLSAEALGRLTLLPLTPIDLTRLLTITFITLIDSALEIPRSDILPCAPSTIVGISAIRSSELSRLAAVTFAVAAVVIVEIWAAVRELESVLLVLREETLECLELLAEMRLVLSSPITEEAREDVLVPVPVVPVSDAVDEELSPSSLLEQPETSNAILNIKTNQENKLFILILLKNVEEEGLSSYKFKLLNYILLKQLI